MSLLFVNVGKLSVRTFYKRIFSKNIKSMGTLIGYYIFFIFKKYLLYPLQDSKSSCIEMFEPCIRVQAY